MGLKAALEKLDDAIQDLSSLHVQTFTGSVDFSSSGKGYEDILKTIQTAQNNNSITLVAESLLKFDGDSYNFVTNKDSGVPSSALALHKAAVEGGIKARQGLMQLAKGVFD